MARFNLISFCSECGKSTERCSCRSSKGIFKGSPQDKMIKQAPEPPEEEASKEPEAPEDENGVNSTDDTSGDQKEADANASEGTKDQPQTQRNNKKAKRR